MQKHGLTLIELVVVTLLCGILVCCMAVLFVGNLKFQKVINGQIAVSQEIAVAMDDMTRMLRFFNNGAGDVLTGNNSNGYTSWISANIQGGHLSGITADFNVLYGFKGNVLERTVTPTNGTPATATLASCIAGFTPSYTPGTREIKLSLTASKDNGNLTATTSVITLSN